MSKLLEPIRMQINQAAAELLAHQHDHHQRKREREREREEEEEDMIMKVITEYIYI